MKKVYNRFNQPMSEEYSRLYNRYIKWEDTQIPDYHQVDKHPFVSWACNADLTIEELQIIAKEHFFMPEKLAQPIHELIKTKLIGLWAE